LVERLVGGPEACEASFLLSGRCMTRASASPRRRATPRAKTWELGRHDQPLLVPPVATTDPCPAAFGPESID